jgi:hypothetical protein
MATQTVIIAKNPFEPETWVTHETSDIRELLTKEFTEWPSTARIYHEQVAVENDITPNTEADVERLGELDGVFYVVVYAGDPISIIIAVVSIAFVAASLLLFRPQLPNLRNDTSSSPNNSLSDRTNQARPAKRIPDIFGTVRSTPDLLTVPLKIFKGNQEVEICYMCVGRGEYDITDVKDDTTLASSISGMSVEVYAPFTSPKSGDSPQLSIGAPITDELLDVKRITQVNGQTLHATNEKSYTGLFNLRFGYPNRLRDRNHDTDFSKIFEVGDVVTVQAPDYNGYNFSGTYTISSFGTLGGSGNNNTIYFTNPVAINPDWAALSTFSHQETGSLSVVKVQAAVDAIAGPFDVDLGSDGKVIINCVALNGLYEDDGTNQTALSVTVQTSIQALDDSNTPIGTPSLFLNTLVGSSASKSQIGLTFECNPQFKGKVRIYISRVTPQDKNFEGQVVDEVKVRDLYVVKPITVSDFGNITSVFAVTYATEGALAVKERKLNMLATRKVPQRTGTNTFGSLVASNSADDIICAMALDEHIGNRSVSELDVPNIYATVAEIISYFGIGTAPSEFCYTFDDNEVSFEETVQTVADAIFCQAYRQGAVIRLAFERQTNNSVLLFNHRNKIPGSERRTVNFGRGEDFDGVEYQYVDPSDDAIIKYYIPGDQSAVNPKQVESAGIRNHEQAYFHAWRIWNKIVYQNTVVEFEGTQESDLIVVQDRILVADNTRSDTQDGEVLAQSGLELTLSQNVTFAMGVSYIIYLQYSNATVEAISVTAGSAPNKVVLATAPAMPLSTDRNNYALTTYQIVGSNDVRSTPFLVQSKEPQAKFTNIVTAYNYDDRYYGNDDRTTHATDFSNTMFSWDNVCLTWDNDGAPYVPCGYTLLSADTAIPANNSTLDGLTGGVTFTLGAGESLRIEKVPGLTYDAWSFTPYDAYPGFPHPYRADFAVRDASGTITHYWGDASVMYDTMADAYAHMLAQPPVILTGSTSYTIFLYDATVDDNRGGLSLVVYKI